MRADLASAKVDIVIVASSSTADQELIAQPDIKSINGLRGKTLIVDAPDTQNAVMMKKILLTNGLRPGIDYKMLSVSTRAYPRCARTRNMPQECSPAQRRFKPRKKAS